MKSFHISTILLGPVRYSFFDAKNLSPSVSYLKACQGQVYSAIISILPCIYLFAIHIGICSECDKNGSGPTLHKFEKLGDVHRNTLRQSIWYD